MSYSALHDSIWKDFRDEGYSLPEIGLFLYLCRNTHSNNIGIYYLPRLYIAHELRLDQDFVDDTIAKLRRDGHIDYDDASETVLVVNFVKWNKITNPKHAKGVAATAARYIENPMYKMFYQVVKDCYPEYVDNPKHPDIQFKKPIDSLSKGYEEEKLTVIHNRAESLTKAYRKPMPKDKDKNKDDINQGDINTPDYIDTAYIYSDGKKISFCREAATSYAQEICSFLFENYTSSDIEEVVGLIYTYDFADFIEAVNRCAQYKGRTVSYLIKILETNAREGSMNDYGSQEDAAGAGAAV